MRHQIPLGTITIPSGQTAGSVLVLSPTKETLVDLIIYAPAALTGTCTVYVGPVTDGAFASCSKLYVGGAALTVPAAAAVQIPVAAFFQISVGSGTAEGADRVFTLVAQVDMGF